MTKRNNREFKARIEEKIEEFYKENDAKEYLVLYVSPREIFEEMMSISCMNNYYFELKALIECSVEEIWYRGALLKCTKSSRNQILVKTTPTTI